MICHDLRLRRDICRREGRQFQSLRFDPSKWFEVLEEEVVFGELGWQLNTVVATSLRHPDDGLDFFDLFVIRRRDTIQVRCRLGAEIGGGDESAEDVLRKDVGVRGRVVLDIIVRNIDMLQTEG